MLVLWEQDAQTVGAIGSRLYLDSGTLSPLLKRMESAKLVTRIRDDADERRVSVNLTDLGPALRDRALAVPQALSNGIEPGGLDELRKSVRALVDTLSRRHLQIASKGKAAEKVRPSNLQQRIPIHTRRLSI